MVIYLEVIADNAILNIKIFHPISINLIVITLTLGTERVLRVSNSAGRIEVRRK